MRKSDPSISVTILEGGSTVLAKIFREEGFADGYAEGYAEGIDIGRAEARTESQAEIAELHERVKRLEVAKGESKE